MKIVSPFLAADQAPDAAAFHGDDARETAFSGQNICIFFFGALCYNGLNSIEETGGVAVDNFLIANIAV